MRHLSCFAAAAALAVPQPTDAQIDAGGLGRLPLTPLQQRVDLVAPPFSSSTAITNPLFPIGRLQSAILNGRVDGRPLKIETTLLPDTRIIEWSPGHCVRTLVSQFVAYRGGRIQEVALDFYAQADDGSVWYFGEDVFNYKRGVVNDTAGSWLAGKEGPAAMIMPGQPAVGMAYRPENIPGLVFEEVTIKQTGRTVQGPRGPVQGAIVAGELHDDGSREDKLFAPGYGEFRSSDKTDLEALAVAVPTDALATPMPAGLTTLHRTAIAALKGRRPELGRMRRAWRAVRRSGVPRRLVPPMSRALRARDVFAIADAALDLQLQYRPQAEIDRERFELWALRARADARARRGAALSGDTATLTWIRDRIARSLDPVALARLDRRLGDLESAAADREFEQAVRHARVLTKIG